VTNARIIEAFLAETLERTDVPGKLRKLVVCHIIKGNKLGDEIRAVSVPDDAGEEWRTSTAAKIADQAAAEAIALSSGVQRYAVQALFEGDDKPRGRTIITAAGTDEDDGALDTEGPDEQGLVTQAMAQTRFFAQLASHSSLRQVQALQTSVDRLTKENEELRAERLKSIRVVEEIMSARHERELELAREHSKAKVLEQTADKLGLLIPVAVNHIAGRKLLPENAPERMLVQAFAQRLTPEKLQRLAASGAFDEAELVAFLNIMQSLAGAAPKADPPAAPSNGAAS
jgi:hypothetical protein